MLVLATKRARVIQGKGGEGGEGATTINILFVSVLMASRWTLGGQFLSNARREKNFRSSLVARVLLLCLVQIFCFQDLPYTHRKEEEKIHIAITIAIQILYIHVH